MSLQTIKSKENVRCFSINSETKTMRLQITTYNGYIIDRFSNM